jgi:hypothetical protein
MAAALAADGGADSELAHGGANSRGQARLTERMFFFEKKNQKTFASVRALVTNPRQPIKVFRFFFSKKKTFLQSCR